MQIKAKLSIRPAEIESLDKTKKDDKKTVAYNKGKKKIFFSFPYTEQPSYKKMKCGIADTMFFFFYKKIAYTCTISNDNDNNNNDDI